MDEFPSTFGQAVRKRALFAVAGGLVAASSVAARAQPAAGPSVSPAAVSDIPFAIWVQVNALTQGYADCIDRFDIGGLTALFHPDGVYDYAPGLQMRGHEQIAAGARRALAGVARSCHFVGPPVVTAADEAGVYASRVYFDAYHQEKEGGTHTARGRYLDILRPDPSGRLLIARRQAVTHTVENMTGSRYWLDRAPS